MTGLYRLLAWQSFIVVRPPPSKSNHPLNLQVQLVPPTGRQPTIVRRSESRDSDLGSLPSSASSGDTSLSRTNSARSEISAYSSVTSLSTLSSTTSSTASARRMIIPLYNLQAHNVMTNVIVDAGTDAKIAKFQKRGLEVIGLAVVEPIEVAGGARYEDVSGPAYNPALLSAEPQGTGQGRTPTSSRLSLNSGDTHESAAVAVTPTPGAMQAPSSPSPATAPSDRSGARRLLGKVFRKKDNQSQASPTLPSSPLPGVDSPSQSRPSKRSSLLLSQPLTHSPQAHSHVDPPTPTPTMPTVLGIQPTLRAPSPSYIISGNRDHKSVRPTSYVWVVRKWLKESPTAPEGVDVLSLVEIRFDWTRATSHSSARRGSGSRTRRQQTSSSTTANRNSVLSSNTPSTSSLAGAGSRRPASSHSPQSQSVSPALPRRSLERSPSPRHSIRTSTTSTESDHSPPLPGMSGAARDHALSDGDDGEESDPEDSETPWTCHLVVRRLVRIPMGEDPAGTASAHSGDVRVKVGAVVPAPHHPKVVALLKIPFPLPDLYIHVHTAGSSRAPYPQHYSYVEIEARKRVITPAGVARPAPVSGNAMAMDPPKTPTQANAVGKFAQNAGNFISAQSRALKSRTGNGHNGSGNGNGYLGVPDNGNGDAVLVSGVLLSAEEIKDMVCCTALWVVVREAFGGVGRVSRKGDGWRIRG